MTSNPAGASWLQLLRPVRRVAELGMFGSTVPPQAKLTMTMKSTSRISSAVSGIALAISCSVEGASFTPLGDIEVAYGISYDARFVGGGTFWEAARWSEGGSILRLGFLDDETFSTAFDMSPDGQVLVGVSGDRAFRWSATNGMIDLGKLPGKTYHVAWSVSGDGSTVVGSGDIGGNEEHVEPFRWTTNGGMVSLGFLPGASRGEALAISRDGQVIVGYSGNDDVQAFRRGTDGIMRGLGFLPGYIESIARSVSSDGLVVVGDCRNASGGSQAFRWTASGGMQQLGLLAGYDESKAEAVSADGALVVGDVSSFNSQTGFRSRAFIWDAAQGMRELQVVLTSQFGLNLSGWALERATAVSADASAIVGAGTNPQGRASYQESVGFSESVKRSPSPSTSFH